MRAFFSRASCVRVLTASLLLAACVRPAPDPDPVPPARPQPQTPAAPQPVLPGTVNVDPARVDAPNEMGPRRGATSLPNTAPAVPREFRAVWVATVDNIDWPSRRDLSTADQQRELRAILDRVRELGMNAVVFQVRPAGDAMYPSKLEPWSAYLTGAQGRAPSPAWDPLAFAVSEAHARGLELHAWFNPYRARHFSDKTPLDPTHMAVATPQLVKRYGQYLWMDPGEPAVVERALDVIVDVVKRYDVDGVHVDDYFYPYKENDARGVVIPFPDEPSFARYTSRGGTLQLDDWRRANVDTFVEQMYARVKRAKSWVKVGISPFGIWRPGFPSDVRGFDSYAQLYGDSRKWLREGWLDYNTPQLYWPINKDGQPYPSLLNWWASENVKGRHYWPGNYTSRVGTNETWSANELVNQIGVTRRQGTATGNVHFSMSVFMPPRGAAVQRPERDSLAERLKRETYAIPALVPASPWLSSGAERLAPPALRQERDARTGATFIVASAPPNQIVRTWIVRKWDGRAWTTELRPADVNPLTITVTANTNDGIGYWVSWIDRVGAESPRAGWLRTDDGAVRNIAP
jgi:uncharacterized lipoprotein YddW (UPF0748 family)